jgi:hypothetical protein
MHEALKGWENFYVIVGSSAAALIGLSFIVIALINDVRGARARAEGSHITLSAFATPTVVHLSGALLISAIMSAPWPTLGSAAVAVGLFAVIGLVYGLTIIRHAKTQTEYKPVMEDWIWHVVLPGVAYATLIVASILLSWMPRTAGFLIGGATISMLFIAIHNAWDTVIYMVAGQTPP